VLLHNHPAAIRNHGIPKPWGYIRVNVSFVTGWGKGVDKIERAEEAISPCNDEVLRLGSPIAIICKVLPPNDYVVCHQSRELLKQTFKKRLLLEETPLAGLLPAARGVEQLSQRTGMHWRGIKYEVGTVAQLSELFLRISGIGGISQKNNKGMGRSGYRAGAGFMPNAPSVRSSFLDPPRWQSLAHSRRTTPWPAVWR
jgi:hypothetical protein